MFTGIVEEMGQVVEMQNVSEESVQLSIKANVVLEDVRIGDSISVNGICLTVTKENGSIFQVDVMPETIRATSLVDLEVGSRVNLERALLPTDRMGGHFVTGHVDGVGEIMKKTAYENAVYYDIQIPEQLYQYMIMKGSIAVDGVSLTIFGVNEEHHTITISLIPHTMDVTVLGDKGVGDIVNIEGDMLAKHVHNYLKKTRV